MIFHFDTVKVLLSLDLKDSLYPYIKDLFNSSSKAKHFIFEEKLPVINEKELNTSVSTIESLPFQTCVFEMRDSHQPVFIAKYKGELFRIFCVLIHEISPGKIISCSLERGINGMPVLGYYNVNDNNYIYDLLIQHIKASKMGIEEWNEEIKTPRKIGVGYHKSVQVKSIIRIVPKKSKIDYKPLKSRTIIWSHKWEVMGHWRKINGIGKNRENEYSVNGFTWVVPHTKGPDHKDLITKTRLIIGNKNENSTIL